MLELEQGKNLDQVLTSFTRITPETYAAVGASKLPIPREVVLKRRKP